MPPIVESVPYGRHNLFDILQHRATVYQVIKSFDDRFRITVKLAVPTADKTLMSLLRVNRATQGATFKVVSGNFAMALVSKMAGAAHMTSISSVDRT